MPRIYLQVPFPEKDEARKLGAHWDLKLKQWYVPDGVNLVAFDKWLPKPWSPSIRAPYWYLATSTRACWRCEAITRVFEIRLPSGYETPHVADDPADDCWVSGEDLTRLSYIGDVPGSVAAQLRQRSPRYRIDYSQITQSFYWMNHCEHCEAKLGDFNTLEEFGAFDNLIAMVKIDEFFTASCGGYTQ